MESTITTASPDHYPGDSARSTASRLAFTTLGIPGVPLTDVADLARRTGWRGVELRSSPDEPVHVRMSAAEVESSHHDLAGVTIVATNSYVRCASSELSDEEVVGAALAEARLAESLGAPAVRVFPGGAEPGTKNADACEEAMVRRLKTATEQLPGSVELWLETHDSHRSGESVARVLQAVGNERVRAIWDIAHPPKAGEPWRRTLEVILPYLAHVQIKDERPGQVPLFLGAGDVPVADIVRALEAAGYSGWYSLEYELKWHPEAPALERALNVGLEWWYQQGL